MKLTILDYDKDEILSTDINTKEVSAVMIAHNLLIKGRQFIIDIDKTLFIIPEFDCYSPSESFIVLTGEEVEKEEKLF